MNRNTLLKSIITLVLLALLPSMTTAATETITWIHTDHLGTPIAGRNDAGETTWEQAYAPWGEKQAVTGVPQAPAGVGYTGHVYDEQVGLIYAGARWYDPAMGRFISPDAVRFSLASSSSFNRYAYSNNSAFMFTDPDGHLADIVADIGFIGYSIYTFASEPTWTNGLALGADVAGAMIPLATGLGAAVRTGKQAEGIVAGAKNADDTVDVYRVFGGDARAQGFSWTTIDPRTVSNFRDAAGLPSGGASGAINTADFLIKGTVKSADIIKSRSALPLDGNKGGLIELIIDPDNVNITDFSILTP
ncbi:MAG: RHS domain-containing protein [Marinobacter sp.]|nr:RHS domain-containing protein [Marinobacter sp.]